jgi:hypothetical protein
MTQMHEFQQLNVIGVEGRRARGLRQPNAV